MYRSMMYLKYDKEGKENVDGASDDEKNHDAYVFRSNGSVVILWYRFFPS